jgi:hypothetical protein
MPVWIEGDEDGRLVLVDGKLAAVVTRLDNDIHHPEQRGKWHLEAAFGSCSLSTCGMLFQSLTDVQQWIERCFADASPALLIN